MEMVKIFTDGSSRGNPGPGGFGAIIFVNESVIELGGFEDETTNNRMEIKASIESLKYLLKSFPEYSNIQIHTDSKYLLKGITEWIFNWQRNGWLTKNNEKVLNDDLWQELLEVSKNLNIEWIYVAGHSGINLNERADEIATSFALKSDIKLFNGKKSDYVVNNYERKSSSNKGKAYSYVSMVDGIIETHSSWKECEDRVKGKKGAKFRKSLSPQNEKEIIEEFKSLI